MRYLMFLLILLAATSCSIQKRHYRPGFFVQRNATPPEATATKPAKATPVQSQQLTQAASSPSAKTGTHVSPAVNRSPGKTKPEKQLLFHPARTKPIVAGFSCNLKKQNVFRRTAAPKEGYSKRRKSLLILGVIALLFAVFLLFSGETAGFAGIGILLLILAVLLLLGAMAKDKSGEKEEKEKPAPPTDPDAANEKRLKKKKRNMWVLPGVFVPAFLLVVSLLILTTTLSTLTVVLFLLLLFGISLLFLFLLLMGKMELDLTKDKIKKQQDSGSGK